jgi:hypothetical protein
MTMAIDENEFHEIETLLASDQPHAAEFRQRFPGLSFTPCSSSDMNGEPVYRSHPGFDLYLVDGSEHCVQYTTEPANATGIVVARHPRKRKTA